ncbi:MurR/RpiR family transcriptional regulator [Oceanobacillus bengalensis]|uniref:MurR/RpiR family transcriptional regulator n=1 Tax=Oceanobacillus bengalensis TaxID=1435466 RepID=A0A494YSI8_9BACI|nr:MurR/RpiR family transcriptional regulator [Oceanobacillus bengalensis]RKQ12953.1 MurR/RpiR family transcriptional regulator [Oceanobacillus bengalensis]
MSNKNIISRILEKKNGLPKKQRIFCDFVIENFRNIGLDGVSEMAEKAGVGNTTVLRAVKNLGYSNFNDFKKEIHALSIDSRVPKWWNFDQSEEKIGGGRESNIERIWDEINVLQRISLDDFLIEGIEETVELIISSETTHVFGLRTSRVAAIYFENLINQFYPKVNQLSYEPYFIMDRLYHMKKGDVVVIIALSPFTQLSYQAAKYCKELGHPIILITDDENNSLKAFASIVLKTIRHDEHYTMVPLISLIETITVMLGKHMKNDSQKKLEKIGQLLVEKNITTI